MHKSFKHYHTTRLSHHNATRKNPQKHGNKTLSNINKREGNNMKQRRLIINQIQLK